MFFPIAEIKIQVWHPGRFSHRCWKHLRGWRLCHVGHSHQGRGHWNFWPTIIRGKFHGHGQHSQKPSFWNCCGSVKLKYWSNPLHQQAKSVDLHRLYKCVFMHMWICIYIYTCVCIWCTIGGAPELWSPRTEVPLYPPRLWPAPGIEVVWNLRPGTCWMRLVVHMNGV